MDLVHYNCMTAAGLGVDVFMQGLYKGIDHSTVIHECTWPQAAVQSPGGGRVCFIPKSVSLKSQIISNSYFQKFENYFEQLSEPFFNKISEQECSQLKNEKNLLLFASTKGIIEDFIWKTDDLNQAREAIDPFSPIVEKIKQIFFKKNIIFSEVQVISNACSSSHIAIEVANLCVQIAEYDNVFIVSADLIGPFIYKGFQSLKVMSSTLNKPFAADRDGLQLGESISLLLFSKKSETRKDCMQVLAVASETEGGSVTRPSMDGNSLYKAMQKVLNKSALESTFKPDFFVAHGTGTKFNDLSEELAINRICSDYQLSKTPVIGIKWSVGHTLGASGALDLIAASEIIKRKKIFNIKNTQTVDKVFQSHLLVDAANVESQVDNSFKTAMITSLGFGGVHSALLIREKL